MCRDLPVYRIHCTLVFRLKSMKKVLCKRRNSSVTLFSNLVSFLSSILYTYLLDLALDPELVRGNRDLSSQLKIRKDRLAWLIQFINENTVLIKVNITLLVDVEPDSSVN